jgi:hypothetical protein
MSISRRVAATLSGLVLAGAVSSGPALAATETAASSTSSTANIATARTDPSQGFCNPEEDGDLKLGGDGHLYRCSYVWGLGWYWQPA